MGGVAGRTRPFAWCPAEGAPQLPVEVASLLVGPLVAVCHTDTLQVAKVVFGRLIARLRRRLLVEGPDVGCYLHGGVLGDVRVAVLGGPDNRLGAGDPRHPDGWMGLLKRQYPRVHHTVLEVLALPAERAWGGPRLYYQVVGLVEALPVVGGVDVDRHALGAHASHEPAHHPSARDVVHHGHLFRHPQRVLVDGQDVAQQNDTPLLGVAGKDGPDEVDARHHVQGVVVVLVNHHPVEPLLGCVLELVKIHAIQPRRRGSIELLVGQHEACIAQLGSKLLRVGRVGHLVEEQDLFDHSNPLSSEAITSARIALP